MWTRSREEFDEILMLVFGCSLLTVSCGSSACSHCVLSTTILHDGRTLVGVLMGLLVLVLAFPIDQDWTITNQYITNHTHTRLTTLLTAKPKSLFLTGSFRARFRSSLRSPVLLLVQNQRPSMTRFQLGTQKLSVCLSDPHSPRNNDLFGKGGK